MCLLSGWELQRRFRPQVLVLEDRNAPGSLLGDLFADALAAALLPAPIGHEVRPDDDPRREVLRFSLPEGESPAPAAPEALRGGSDMGTTGGGVVSVRDADESAFFWLPESTANASLPVGDLPPAIFPRDAIGPDAPVSTGNGVGVRVPAAPLTSPASLAPGFGFVGSLVSTPTEPVGAGDHTSLQVQDEAALEDEPPNTAPIVVDDAATIDEDGYAVIDVTSNDSDADEDELRIDGWDAQPAHGTLRLNVDGELVYTPFRDFAGVDTFTINITDGTETKTSNVTVTVNPVNDVPLAFHDIMTFRNDAYDDDPAWPAGVPYTYAGVVGGSFLANDYDVDSTGLTATYLDTMGTASGVIVDVASGTVSWSGPADFYGETTFRYRVEDSASGISEWATVRLIVFTPTPPLPSAGGSGGTSPPGGGPGSWGNENGPPLPIDPGPPPSWPQAVAVNDITPVGDEVGSDNVTLNDLNVMAAVVLSHPSSTRLTSFGYDGTFEFRPGTPRVDGVYSYRLFGPGGATFAIAQVDMPVVQLDIFNGQGAKSKVTDENDYTTGAFTVANWNDTDGDAIKDFEDAGGVRAAHGAGVDEVDLMKLVINKPTTFGANDKLTVDVTGDSARFYNAATREGTSYTSLTLTSNDFVLTTGAIYWVEAYNPSASLRDINIRMTYRGQSETVRATGVWANITYPGGVRGGGTQRDENGDEESYIRMFEHNITNVAGGVGTLGLSPVFTTITKIAQPPEPPTPMYYVHLANHVEIKLIVTPLGMESEISVKFDVTRTIHAKVWVQTAIGKQPQLTPVVNPNPYKDLANDDRNTGGEDNIPKNGVLLALDTPGYFPLISPEANTANNYASKGVVRIVHRMNAFEFVRIKVDGQNFVHNPFMPDGKTKIKTHEDPGNLQGSRESEHVPWRSRLDFSWDSTAQVWARAPNNDPSHPVNYIGAWHDDLTVPSV